MPLLFIGLLFTLGQPGWVIAEQGCVVQDTIPAAYAELVQTDLHRPIAFWPEMSRNAEGNVLPASPTSAGTHGQLLLGRQTTYLYHLPVFMTDPWSHPHNFQVILEVDFADAGGTARSEYLRDREAHPDTIYTAVPPGFAQTALLLDYPGRAPLRSFESVAIFRNHFERPGREAVVATPMTITNLVHLREFAPNRAKPEEPSYLLFGRDREIFLAHMLSAPPDFDQILEVSILDTNSSAEALARGLFITLTGRSNNVDDRLREGEIIACHGNDQTLRLRVDRESYCETGELQHIVGALAGNNFGQPRECDGN